MQLISAMVNIFTELLTLMRIVPLNKGWHRFNTLETENFTTMLLIQVVLLYKSRRLGGKTLVLVSSS